MAVNDITKLLDFQPSRPVEIAPPEPVQRREPSDYQKALSRSVSSTDKERVIDRPDKPQRQRTETETTQRDARPKPAESHRNDDRTEPTVSNEQTASERNKAASEKPNASSDRTADETSQQTTDTTTTESTATDSKQTEQPQAKFDGSRSPEDGLVATPPPSLSELFPKNEKPVDGSEPKHRSDGDEALSPPQGFGLALKGTAQKAGQSESYIGSDKKPTTPRPWNEALWQKPQSNDESQGKNETGISETLPLEQTVSVKPDVPGEVDLQNKDSTPLTQIGQLPDQTDANESASHDDQSSAESNTNPIAVAPNAIDNSVASQNESDQNQQGGVVAIDSTTVAVNSDSQSSNHEKSKNERESKTAESGKNGSKQNVSTIAANTAQTIANGDVNSPEIADDSGQETSIQNVGVKTTPTQTSRPAATTPTSNGDIVDTGANSVSSNTRSTAIGGAKTEVGLSTTERADFAERVMNAVRGAAEQSRPFRVRLNPPELGSLQVEITQRDGVYSARLEVQTSSAQQALLDHIGHLKESLQQNGIRLDRIDVQLNAAGPDDQAQDGGEQRQQHEGGRQHRDDGQHQRQGYGRQAEEDDFATSLASADDQMDVQI